MTPRPDLLPAKVIPLHRGAAKPHIDLDRIVRDYDGPLDLVELYRDGLKQPSAIRLALREFIDDCRAKPQTAVACALLGLVAGLAVTFGLAELLIVAGVGR